MTTIVISLVALAVAVIACIAGVGNFFLNYQAHRERREHWQLSDRNLSEQATVEHSYPRENSKK